MDGQRFDRWARAFAAASSRRGLIKGLAGTLAAGCFAAGGEDVEAARTCQRCRRGVCTFMPAGTRCGVCGTCDGNGGCNVDSGFDCGPCKKCSQASLRCENKPADAPCGDCATCQRGRCRKTCRARERCCPPNTCAAAGVCCPDEERCGEECCERATERCTADGCCPTACVCGTGSGAHCCGENADCLNGSCCPRSQICRNLELGIKDCCADDEICCPSDHRCKPAKECCKEQCTECETCENGECVPKSDNTPCASGICCGGVCRASACCDDSGCPECGRCRSGRCEPNPAKNGQACGTSGCKVCANGQCVNAGNNSGCRNGTNALCCEGICCAGGQTCCGGVGFAAAGADLCCPFGPPCGEGNAARCCNEDQECCGGVCKRPDECCPEENVCGSECCSQTVLEICTRDGCCAFDRGETACGPGSDPANNALCCGNDEQCCPFGPDQSACCPTTHSCCFGDCCEPGLKCIGDCFHQTGRGCCPQSYPEGGCGACVAATPGRTNPR